MGARSDGARCRPDDHVALVRRLLRFSVCDHLAVMPSKTSRLRPPVATRALLAVIALLGLISIIDFAVDAHPDSGELLFGLIMLVIGTTGALARAQCSEHGVTYRNLRRYRASRDSITDVRVEPRGWIGTFPTLVVHRQSGRPIVMRAVQDYRTKGGRMRQADRASEWQSVLGLTSHD
jgi:hypothetical protein